jgi:hypothetical protein
MATPSKPQQEIRNLKRGSVNYRGSFYKLGGIFYLLRYEMTFSYRTIYLGHSSNSRSIVFAMEVLFVIIQVIIWGATRNHCNRQRQAPCFIEPAALHLRRIDRRSETDGFERL